MKIDKTSLLIGIFIGMIIFISYMFATFFHSPQEVVSFFSGQLDGKKNYWIQPSAGGMPHIRCTTYDYFSGIGICGTDSVWRFDEIAIEYDWNKIAKNNGKDINSEQCKMIYDYVKPFCNTG